MSNKDIDAFKIRIHCYDTYGSPVSDGDSNVFNGIAQNILIKPGEKHNGEWTLNLYENTTKYDVEVVSAHFVDCSVWLP